ncbi:MAG: DUF3617 domain-containing protein [Lautropia sp.]
MDQSHPVRRIGRLPAHACLSLALLAGALPAAPAADLPARKPGLWEMKIETPGNPPVTMQQCIDRSTDADGLSMGQQGGRCSKPEIERSGDTWLVTSRCTHGDRKMVSRGRMTMKGDSAFTGSSTLSYDPPLAGRRDVESKVQARWTGPCAAGMKPGDMKMQGMPSFNPRDFQGASGAAMSPEDIEKRRAQAMKMLEQMKRSGQLPAN